MKTYKEFINEDAVNRPMNEDPLNRKFDEIQEEMKRILVEKYGYPSIEKAETFLLNNGGDDCPANASEKDGLIIQFSKKIQKMVDDMINKQGLTTEETAEKILKQYYPLTKFNNLPTEVPNQIENPTLNSPD
jgi:hypothetical protein